MVDFRRVQTHLISALPSNLGAFAGSCLKVIDVEFAKTIAESESLQNLNPKPIQAGSIGLGLTVISSLLMTYYRQPDLWSNIVAHYRFPNSPSPLSGVAIETSINVAAYAAGYGASFLILSAATAATSTPIKIAAVAASLLVSSVVHYGLNEVAEPHFPGILT